MPIKKNLLLLLVLTMSTIFANAQIITTVAGTGATGHTGDEGLATIAEIKDPGSITFDVFGNYYFVEAIGNRIRKVMPTGIISTIAGVGGTGYIGDNGPATAAQFNNIAGITSDNAGNLYIADCYNNVIRKIDFVTNVVTTIAGNGTSGFSGDQGQATLALLKEPSDLCFDRIGNLYFIDGGNFCIRKINTNGIITTVAGNYTPGFSGDGGPATAAQMQAGIGICIDSVGNLYFTDRSNSRVRKIDLTGNINTIAGNGLSFSTGDEGPATTAQLNPEKITFDGSDNLYISCIYKHSVRKIDNSGIIHTVAGDTIAGYSGDGGPATVAQLNQPIGIAFDLCGSLYIADALNNRIRKVTYPPILTTPSITINGVPAAFVGTPVTITATVANAGSSYIIHWLNHGIQFTTTTVPSVTYTKTNSTDTITARVVSTASYGCYDSTTSAGHIVMIADGVGSVLAFPYRIYPNPANDVLYVEGAGANSTYKIISMVGTIMQQGALSGSIAIPSLPGGMYLFEVTDANGTKAVTRIIKQ